MGGCCGSSSAAASLEQDEFYAASHLAVEGNSPPGTPLHGSPHPHDMMVRIDGWYRTTGHDSHVKYNLVVCRKPRGDSDPQPLWSIQRRYQEMAPVFKRLREFDKVEHALPEVPAGTRLRGSSSSSHQSKEDERVAGFTRLFNAVLSDRFLCWYPDFHRLLGAPVGLGSSTPLQAQQFDSAAVLDGGFQQALRRSRDTAAGSSAASLSTQASPEHSSSGNVPLSNSLSPRRSSARSSGKRNREVYSRWTRVSRLGSGAMGTVWLGLLDDARQVAVKVVPMQSVNETARETVADEFHLLSKLRHANIVSVLCHRFVNCELEIFLEFVPGGSVATLVKKVGRLPRQVIRKYVAQALDALVYLHSRAVVHRDIKGANLLVGSAGELKLADFGCSRCLSLGGLTPSGEVAEPTGATTMAGTPFWMAPEVISPQKAGGAYGFKCDVWSLGCVTIEMLGVTPWAQLQGASAWETMYSIANSKARPELPPDVDPVLHSFIHRCLNRDVSRRPGASALLDDEFLADACV